MKLSLGKGSFPWSITQFMLATATGLLGAAVMLTGTVHPATAQSSPRVAASEPTAQPTAQPDLEPSNESLPPQPSTPTVPIDLASYAYEDLFAIGFPDGWQVTEQSASPQVTALAPATAGTTPMRTEVTWHEMPPREIVPQALQTIQSSGYTVARYDAINVDNTTALRIWLTDLPAAGLPNAFMTYVGYQNATAVIVSYYGDPTTDLDNLLSGIHQSFERLNQE
ncbi:MAG: hypothetical protein HC929_06730 [Leptolyngbyaceae cyanobacterium SM2_5_2]|nr:hypothetical protein [Leptolyngbyaceae cyanobacterium SM2_5_2]